MASFCNGNFVTHEWHLWSEGADLGAAGAPAAMLKAMRGGGLLYPKRVSKVSV